MAIAEHALHLALQKGKRASPGRHDCKAWSSHGLKMRRSINVTSEPSRVGLTVARQQSAMFAASASSVLELTVDSRWTCRSSLHVSASSLAVQLPLLGTKR